MTAGEFSTGEWIDRLAQALPGLAEAQEPWLQEYYRQTRRVLAPYVEQNRDPPAFPLDDVQILYARARHSHAFGEEKPYAALLAALDPVRYVLLSHPTLARVVSRIIGRDDFWMQILDSGILTSLTDLIGGLMARADELPGDGFRAAASELNAFLVPAGDGESSGVLGDLDVGCDTVLFWGLTLKERIDIGEGMAILPFEQARAFVDESLVKELAPRGAGFHGWSSVGAIMRPFRWRPKFRREGSIDEDAPGPTGPFFLEAQIFLELLAVAHAAPVLRLAEFSNCTDRSAGRLLGWERHGTGFYQSWQAHGFDGIKVSPELATEALAEAKEAFENRKGERYGRMAPIVGRLAEALARRGQYAADDRVLDVAIALERMFKPGDTGISAQLQEKVADFLEGDDESQARVKHAVKRFYDVRSAIIHGPKDERKRSLLEDRNKAFGAGFDLARRSLFKMLRDSPPS